MSAHNTKDPQSANSGPRRRPENPETRGDTEAPGKDRERLRDLIVVFVTYPLTPTKEANQLAEKKPWLEFLSLLLKVALALYALYEAVVK